MIQRDPLLSRDQLREVDALHQTMMDPIEAMASELSHGVLHVQHITFRQFLQGWDEAEGWGEADVFKMIGPESDTDSVRVGVGPRVTEGLAGLMPVPDWDLATTGGITSVLVGLLAMAWQIHGGSIDLSGSQFAESDQDGELDHLVVSVTHWFESKRRDHHVAVCYDESFLVRMMG
jgi:hypothetical protein